MAAGSYVGGCRPINKMEVEKEEKQEKILGHMKGSVTDIIDPRNSNIIVTNYYQSCRNRG